MEHGEGDLSGLRRIEKAEASAGDSSPARTSITVTEGLAAFSVSKIFI
jgi:hypothetical protein